MRLALSKSWPPKWYPTKPLLFAYLGEGIRIWRKFLGSVNDMTLSRITTRLNTCREEERAALIAYITAGDPNLSTTLTLMHTLVRTGVDVIELGIPFSDPMADGPIIQASHQRALEEGVTLSKIFPLVSEFRRLDNSTPIVLMGYLNPIEQMGSTAFCEAAFGMIDGVLVVDMPVEESADFNGLLKHYQLDFIGLIAPTTSSMRLHHIEQAAGGFLYYIALKGTTGALHLQAEPVRQKLIEIKKRITLPLVVGFGIQNVATAKVLANVADGVVVGSSLLKIVERHRLDSVQMLSVASEFIQQLRKAVGKNE